MKEWRERQQYGQARLPFSFHRKEERRVGRCEVNFDEDDQSGGHGGRGARGHSIKQEEERRGESVQCVRD